MKIAIAGASGLIGRALADALSERGDEVIRVVRRLPANDAEVSWNPTEGELDAARLEGTDAIVNLAGENIAGGRWTAARRDLIWRSRIDATRTLIVALDRLARKPAVFLNASAVGFYGDRSDEELSETSAPGVGFLPELCLAWETHAEGAKRRGVRTAALRFGVVLARDGGALAKMLPLFRFGLGGRLGSGAQWMSWVSLDDAVGAMLHALDDPRGAGAINVVAPEPVTNADFTATLARELSVPAAFPVPAWLLRLRFGAMADQLLLASARVRPERLLERGFRFQHATLQSALQAAKL